MGGEREMGMRIRSKGRKIARAGKADAGKKVGYLRWSGLGGKRKRIAGVARKEDAEIKLRRHLDTRKGSESQPRLRSRKQTVGR